ncbi:MAG: NACHT domain-containing protein [Oscillospiraceae bacterium]|jgi:DNA polymerase III delta prime subunit|nr:NACHT domain-containing protein [Oscillospiraceae bacterium]
MNKKIAVILFILFAFGLVICILTKWEWALQMLIAGVVMVIIIAVKSRKGHNGSILTILAELIAILSLSGSPNIMNGLLPKLNELRTWVNTQVNADWLTINVYKNIAFAVIFLIMYLLSYLAIKLFQDKTVMKKHRGKLPHKLNNPDFLSKREHFCSSLKVDLASIDLDTRWNDFHFTPLDADVIVEENFKTKKRSCNLMKALRKRTYDRAFLLLGDPGSGKSTVLRKLAKDLLSEVEKTNKIPVYINLKEWQIHGQFSESSPPSVNHLIDFIKQNLTERLNDIFVSGFLNDYFMPLYEEGQFYFIFDSFDEIPFLLDETERSWLVDKISSTLFKACAHNKNAKVILSSRFFRKPTDQFQAKTKMHVKPFTERQIQTCFNNSTKNKTLSKLIFTEHKELINIARNPFYAGLISSYYTNTQRLPAKEVELYKNYIQTRILQCENTYELLTKNRISVDDVIRHGQKIAEVIFEKGGWEIASQELIDGYKIPPYVIDILQKAKFIRVGSSSKRAISFSHRRFNEYFVAISLVGRDISALLESIPTDSKWRDTLVLYAQICEESKANELIAFCCSFFKEITTRRIAFIDDNFRRAVHSLRFLIDAYASQPMAIAEFYKEVSDFIKLLMNNGANQFSGGELLYLKIALQAIPILEQKHIAEVLDIVLERDNTRLIDEAILSCSYLSELSETIYYKLVRYFTFLGFFKFIKKYRQHMFYLSLSKNFRIIRRVCVYRFASLIEVFIGITIFFLITYKYKVILAAQIFIIYLIFNYLSKISFPLSLRIHNHKISRVGLPFNFIISVLYIITYITINPLISITYILFSNKLELYLFVLYIKMIKKNNLSETKIFSKYLFFAYIMYFFAIGVFTSMQFSRNSTELSKIFLLIILFVSVAFNETIFDLIIFLKNLKNDKNILRANAISNQVDRALLSVILKQLKTRYYQRKFLTELGEKNVKAFGEWEDRQLPILRGDLLNVMLSQLEEKWSGL